ncbi:MAG: type IV pilin [Salinigranum sp.]
MPSKQTDSRNRDSRGATSVVGSVLLVAVVVVLAAVVGGAAVSISHRVGSPATGTVSVSQRGLLTAAETAGTVEVTYERGNVESVDGDLRVNVEGTPVTENPHVRYAHGGFGPSLTEGETATIAQVDGTGLQAGTEVTVVVRESGQSTLLGQRTLSGFDRGDFRIAYHSLNCKFDPSITVTNRGSGIEWGDLRFELNGAPGGGRKLDGTGSSAVMNAGDRYKWIRTGGYCSDFPSPTTVRVYYTGGRTAVLVAEKTVN